MSKSIAKRTWRLNYSFTFSLPILKFQSFLGFMVFSFAVVSYFWTFFITFQIFPSSYWFLRIKWYSYLTFNQNIPVNAVLQNRFKEPVSLLSVSQYLERAMRKVPSFNLISPYGNFVETHSFCRVSDKSPETLQKMCVFQKIPAPGN